MIPQSFIQDLLNRVDIVDVVERYVPLKKAGANYVACCPFHGEKTPSFTVSQTKQFYHCFGCGAHGTAIGFMIEYAGVGFIDAVKEIARERAQSFLRSEHQSRILNTYTAFTDDPGFSAVVDTPTIGTKDWSLAIPLYVDREGGGVAASVRVASELNPTTDAWAQWKTEGEAFWRQMDEVTAMLDGVVAQEARDG